MLKTVKAELAWFLCHHFVFTVQLNEVSYQCGLRIIPAKLWRHQSQTLFRGFRLQLRLLIKKYLALKGVFVYSKCCLFNIAALKPLEMPRERQFSLKCDQKYFITNTNVLWSAFVYGCCIKDSSGRSPQILVSDLWNSSKANFLLAEIELWFRNLIYKMTRKENKSGCNFRSWRFLWHKTGEQNAEKRLQLPSFSPQ